MTEPTNEHAKLEEPDGRYYGLSGKWYVELTVPHPTNPDYPPQSMTFPVDNQWWAHFIATTVAELPKTVWDDYLNSEEAIEF